MNFTLHASRLTVYCSLITVLLTACSPKSTEPRPPDIAYGQDLCNACGMIIDDAKFAAATLLTSGEFRKFDDVGEMVTYHMDHPEAQVKAWFVHDYESEAWIRGETAFFVLSDNLQTPMGMGVAAFEKREDAEALAAEKGGQVLTLDELRLEMHVMVHGN
jgi:copper chaperone NosL